MNDRLDRLERRLARLEDRFSTLARHAGSQFPAEEPAEPDTPSVSGVADTQARSDSTSPRVIGTDVEDLIARHGLVTLAGLSSLVLAGAVVLRILTLNSPVPLTVGASIGLAYCLGLFCAADHLIRRGRPLYGDTFATISVLVLGSLLVEVTRLPHGFTRETAYGILAALFGVYSAGSILRRRVVPFSIGLLAAPLAGLAIGGVPFHHPALVGILGIAVLAASHGMSRNGWASPRLIPGILSFLYLVVLIFLAATVAMNDRGCIYTGSDVTTFTSGWSLNRDPYPLETSAPGVFASGDVREGAVRRVASAVGEGSVAVTMVHQYLDTV